MPYTPNIRTQDGKAQVFCDWRRKFVRLTPEEEIRQTFLHYLTDDRHYPKNRIAVEHPIQVGGVSKRCDAVVLGNRMQPLCIIEFKAATVELTQRVFDQAAVYNRSLNVPYLIISNGHDTYVCRTTQPITFLPDIPVYEQLWTNSLN